MTPVPTGNGAAAPADLTLGSLVGALGAAIGERLAEAVRPQEAKATVEQAPRSIQSIPWRTMVSEPPKPVEYFWNGWVPKASLALVVGAGDTRKSWLCLHVATVAGASALGEPVARGTALYFTAEAGIEEEQRRCTLLKAGHGLGADLPIHFVAAEDLCFGTDRDYDAIVQLVEKLRPSLIVLDSASVLSGIEDENSNSEVARFVSRRLLPLARRYGATVLVIHHSPKAVGKLTDEQVARGAGAWRNGVDVLLYLRAEPALGDNATVVRVAKARRGRRHAEVAFRVVDVVRDQAVRVELCRDVASVELVPAAGGGPAEAVRLATNLLRACPTMALAELRNQLEQAGVTPKNARTATDMIRGRTPWSFGPHRGRRHVLTSEATRGNRVQLTLLPEAA